MEAFPKAKAENPFDRAGEDIEKIDVGGEAIEVADLKPEKVEDETPVLLAPAWACTIPVYRPALEEIRRGGRRALSLNHPRYGGDMALDEAQQELVKEYPTEEVRKAESLIKVLEAKGIEKTDVIAHSEGAANTMLAALLRPDLFRDVVLFGPAGLIGKDTPLRLLKGFASQGNAKPTLEELPVSAEEKAAAEARGHEAIDYPAIAPTETSKAIGGVVGKEVGGYVLKNPARALAETWGLSKLQMHELLRTLHEKGVMISIMTAVDDPVFPTEKMSATISGTKKEGEDITNIIDGYLTVRGGHGELGDHPETHVVGALALLKAMEAKRAKATGGTSA